MSSMPSLASRILSRVPEVESLFDRHLEDNFGDFLPHVWVGDLQTWAMGQANRYEAQDILQRLTSVVEEILHESHGDLEGHPDANVVAVSFVEGIPLNGPGSQLRRFLGPEATRLLRDFDAIRGLNPKAL